MEKLTIIEKLDLETIRDEKINFSIDMFTEVYNKLESKIIKEILIKFYDVKEPRKLDFIDFSFSILPNYIRVISYKGKDIGFVNLFFEPSNGYCLPIRVEFKPF